MAAVDPFAPWALGPLRLRNRIIKAATFEGVMPRGQVTDELVELHREVAAGGAAMTTVAYCAVSKGGRVNRDTIVLAPGAERDLRWLTAAVHDEGALASAQIGHAGLVASVRSNRQPSMAPSTRFSAPALGRVRGAPRARLAEVVDDFATATRVAVDAGFDAVEVHLGHGYLLSSFLSPRLNRRADGYGGPLEHRLRLAREVLAAVRQAAGPDHAVLAKWNMTDGVRGGFDVTESLEAAALVEADGTVDALVLTGGSSLQNPMFLFRGDVPLAEMATAQRGPAAWGLRLGGRLLFRRYPFAEAYFLPLARRFRERLTMPLVLLGGVNRLDTVERALAEGFDAVAMARALLREPDLPRRWRSGRPEPGACIHCNRCVPTIYSGTCCPVRIESAAVA